MLYNPQGLPIPPQATIKLLQAIDKRFSMRFIPQSELWPVGCWAVMLQWSPNDQRYAMIRSGKAALGSDQDAFCYLPEDCPVEQAAGYVRKACMRWGGSKADINKYVEKLNSFNEGVMEGVKAKEMEYVDELVSTNAPFLFGPDGKKIIRHYVTKRR